MTDPTEPKRSLNALTRRQRRRVRAARRFRATASWTFLGQQVIYVKRSTRKRSRAHDYQSMIEAQIFDRQIPRPFTGRDYRDLFTRAFG